MLITYALMMLENYMATLKREEGQGMAEYGLILALVALVAAAAFIFLGNQVNDLISAVGEQIAAPVP